MNDFTAAKITFLTTLTDNQHTFSATIAFIEQWFDFSPTAFRISDIVNPADKNQGSCRILALSQLLGLDPEQTLRCFGEYYREVLATPDADNHHNLRRAIRDGIDDIEFDQFPLKEKA